jgi:hypothetical protein
VAIFLMKKNTLARFLNCAESDIDSLDNDLFASGDEYFYVFDTSEFAQYFVSYVLDVLETADVCIRDNVGCPTPGVDFFDSFYICRA